MQRTEGTAGVKLIECVSPARNKWRVRWDVQEHDDGSADYMEAGFDHKPTDEEIKAAVIGWYNQQTDQTILSGFEYEGDPVWLSAENQFNYKSAYDLAVQTDGGTLPVKFKFGTDEQPVYRVFEDLADLQDFYTKAMRHIQDTLEAGWQRKDTFDLVQYQIE
ncbi:MAG: hypothetical protein IJ692_04320 [Alloprevotella sp.]|nr:hypothetical protein [Alloprevotella sp.]